MRVEGGPLAWRTPAPQHEGLGCPWGLLGFGRSGQDRPQWRTVCLRGPQDGVSAALLRIVLGGVPEGGPGLPCLMCVGGSPAGSGVTGTSHGSGGQQSCSHRLQCHVLPGSRCVGFLHPSLRDARAQDPVLGGASAGEASLGMALSAIPLSCPLLASKVRLLRTGCG